MKWIFLPCFAAWLLFADSSATAENLPEDVVVHDITVSHKNIPPGRDINLGALPSDVVFRFGSLDNSRLPNSRVRCKLEGYDTNWHDSRCYMFLAVRFYNESGDEIGQPDFRVTGESAGWTGSLTDSALTHRREIVTAPPHAARFLVVISSGGPPATIGVYVVANLTVAKVRSNTAPATLMEFPPYHGFTDETNLNSHEWVRDGNVPSMAKIVAVGRSPSQKALAILDDNPMSHAEWHNTLASVPPIAPGDQILLEWNEMFTMGVADLHAAQYPKLPEGHFLFRVAEFDLFNRPTGVESVARVIVPSPLWRQPWFWPLCAGLAIAIALGNWRYLVWRKVRREMVRLTNQQMLEKERLRIAQDIHDDLGARITEISLASAIAKKSPVLPEAASADFDRISNMSRELVAALYETVWAVNPENDNLDSLGTYLCQMTNHLCEFARIPCRLEINDLPGDVHVSSHVRHNIALAVKEAAHNAVRHSRASEIILRVTFAKPELTVCIKDNGVGFPVNEHDSVTGHSLSNIKRRMENIGGDCQIDSHIGQGTSVQMHLRL